MSEPTRNTEECDRDRSRSEEGIDARSSSEERDAASVNSPRALLAWPRVLLLACLIFTLAMSVQGLHRALADRVPLRLVLGSRWDWTAAALAGAIALGCGALARELSRIDRRAPEDVPLAFLRKLSCVAVIGWLVFLARAQPFKRIHFDLALGIAAGAFAGLILISAWLACLPYGLRRATDITVFSLCAAILGGEIALRAFSVVKPSFVLARVASSPGQVLEQNRCRPGQVRFGFPCNRSGHYDGEFHRKRDGERLVVTIGDSFSIGVVPHALHFTTVCERKLGVDVDNMGVAGTDPPEYLHMLINEALPLDPDVVVIDVFVGNDIVFPAHTRSSTDAGLRAWFDSGNVLLCLVPKRLARLAQEQHSREEEERSRGGSARSNDPLEPESRAEPRNPESDRSSVGTVQGERSSEIVLDESALPSRFPWVVDPSLEIATFSEETFRQIETARATGVCTDSPQIYAPFFETMLDIQRAARATRLCVMLIPDEFQVEDAVWRTAVEGAPDKSLERDRPQRILVPWFESQGIPCLDLLPILRATPPLADGRRHLYHRCDTHFNARGNRAAGEALAKFLRQNFELLRTPADQSR
jgi:hypothetical protein